jgi:L-aminopeptidase/D-esterase-like protein
MIGANSPPTADDGAAAFRARSDAPVEMGSVGAGTGATVSKWSGFENMRKSGIGSAAVRVGTSTVGVLAAVNAVGDVVDLRGRWITGGPTLEAPEVPGSRQNTTLITLATDAHLSKSDLLRLIVRSHDALAACIRPTHTRYDGDIVFAVSCGDEEADMDLLGEAAFNVTAAAIVNSVTQATSVAGVPAVGDV